MDEVTDVSMYGVNVTNPDAGGSRLLGCEHGLTSKLPCRLTMRPSFAAMNAWTQTKLQVSK